MANTIRIKRRSADSTAPTTSQAVNGELAFNENSEILYYGKGGNSSASSSVIKIGGAGAYLTFDTNQTPTGTKTFSTTTLKITGGSSNYVLSTDGSGNISWVSAGTSNAYANITDGTTTAAASGSDTIKFRASGSPLTVTVGSNDVTHGDNVLYTLGTVTTGFGGTGLTSFTAGDLLYYSTGTALSKLAIGSTNNYLKVVSGAPSWANFDTDVNTRALSAFTGSNAADLNINSYKLTNVATPTAGTDAANKNYVDSVATGLDVKASVRLASTTNYSITYTATGGTSARGQITGAPNVIDTVNLAANDRILLKDQSTGAQNGIWVVSTLGTGANGVWDRATDFDSDAEVTAGAFTFVEEGATNADSGWVLTTNNPIVIGGSSGTALAWAQFSGAGQITAGAGLTKSGNTIDVGTASSARIVVNADNIDLATVSRGADNTSATPAAQFLTAVTSDSYGRVTSATFESVRTGSTTQTGILQLTDSTSSTSTTTAATPNSVKTSYDLANAALPKSGGTMTGKITTVTTSTSTANLLLAGAAADPSAPASGDLWNNNGTIKFYNGSATKTIAFLDSTMTGTWNGTTIATNYGGTGLTSFTSGGAVYATSTSALTTGTLPVSAGGTGITSFGSGVATWLGTPSSANLASAITDETGSGSLVFGTGPTISLPVIDNIKIGWTSTATAAGTTTLTSSSNYRQFFTGTTTQTVTLPVATTMVNGQSFEIHNNSTGVVTVQTSGLNTLIAVNGGQTVLVTCINTAGGTGTASWDYDITGASTSTGSGALVYATSPTLVTPTLGTPASGNLSNCTNIPVAQATGTLPTANGGTGLTSFTSGGAVYATSTSVLTTGTLPVSAGGTGAATFTSKGVLYGNGTSAVQVTAAATWDSTNLVGQFLKADSSNNPVWSDTVDGGGY